MKKFTLITLFFLVVLLLNAQIYQNKLLGIPNGNVINFNRTPAVINKLPIHPYLLQSNQTGTGGVSYSAGDELNPFDEDLLLQCFYVDYDYSSPSDYSNLFTEYRGQYPKFCQTIVNDRDGNLIFFIIDNNIYNSKGISFLDLNTLNYDNSGDQYAYLLNKENILDYQQTRSYSLNKEINRFVGESGYDPDISNGIHTSMEDIIIHNKVIVVPFSDNCNKFHIFFMVQENQNG